MKKIIILGAIVLCISVIVVVCICTDNEDKPSNSLSTAQGDNNKKNNKERGSDNSNMIQNGNNKKVEGPPNNNDADQQEESGELLLKKFRETRRSPEKLELGNKVVRLIKKGMSEKEVRAILGDPPWIATTNKNLWCYHLWLSSQIRVLFGEDGKVKKVIRHTMLGENVESEEALSKLFRENRGMGYERRLLAIKISPFIKKGMPKSKVREMLGEPDSKWTYWLWYGAAGMTVYFDKDDNVKEVVLFGDFMG